jgi:Cof subfamily protein (haloacid dehalogenase superfamily)
MIQLICIDVDGTLVGNSGDVTAAVWEAVGRTRERGVRLALCSGRPGFGLARRYAERLDPTGWHVFQNGASVLNLAEGTARSRVIHPSIITKLVLRARETRRALELYTDTDFVVEIDNERTRRHAGLLGVPFKIRDLLSLTAPVVRAQWLVPHSDVAEILAEPHPGLTVLASLSPVMPDTTFINMTSEGVDKSVAIRTVAEAYGMKLANVMMVGDGSNDVTALEAVGFSVAMGNAEANVRAVARYHVADVDRDGVVEALALAESL